MRTVATERAKVAAAKQRLKEAEEELAAWQEKNEAYGNSVPLEKVPEYEEHYARGQRLASKVRSWEREIEQVEESLALVLSEAEDLRQAVTHYEGRTGDGGIYDRLIDEAAKREQVDYYEQQRKDELASLERTRRRLHKLTGENGAGPK